MQAPKPTARGALATTSAADDLPSVDPIKREVSIPYTPTNDSANTAVSFIRGDSTTDYTPINLKNATFTSTETPTNISVEGVVGQAANGVGANDLKRLSDVITPTEDGLRPDYDLVKKRLEDSFGVPGATGDMSNDLKNSLAEGMNNILGVSDSGVMVNGIGDILSGDALKDAKSVTNLINRVTSASGLMEVFDLTAQASFINTITDKLIEWGAPDLIDKLIDSMADVKEQQKMWESVAKRAADASQLDIVIKYGDKMGGSRRSAIWETITKSVLTGYRLKDNESLKSQDALINRTLELYNSNWYKDTNNTSLVSLHFFTMINDAARECMSRGKHRVSVQAGQQVRRRSLTSVILSSFPELGTI